MPIFLILLKIWRFISHFFWDTPNDYKFKNNFLKFNEQCLFDITAPRISHSVLKDFYELYNISKCINSKYALNNFVGNCSRELGFPSETSSALIQLSKKNPTVNHDCAFFSGENNNK